MKRRDFLRSSSILLAGGLAGTRLGWAWANTLSVENNHSTGKLIVIFLRGAADGLNIVVPYSDTRYYESRPTIALAPPGRENGAIYLDADFALHPSLSPLIPLWKKRKLAFVHASGSPDPTRSHFEAQDFMETGKPGERASSSGWLNRLLAELPATNSPLRALNVGTTIPLIFKGTDGMNVASFTPKASRGRSVMDRPLIATGFEKMYLGREDSLGKAFREGLAARSSLKEKLEEEMLEANKGAPAARDFKGFGRQLGNLFVKDPGVQVAFVALGGWDTHFNQGGAKGQLANQLMVLGQGICDLVEGLERKFEDTTILVLSEFGRTVRENGSAGTDHGHGNVAFVLGGQIEGGKVFARWRGLAPEKLFEGRDLPVTIDFRTVVYTSIKESLSLSDSSLGRIFPGYAYDATALKGLVS